MATDDDDDDDDDVAGDDGDDDDDDACRPLAGQLWKYQTSLRSNVGDSKEPRRSKTNARCSSSDESKCGCCCTADCPMQQSAFK